MNKQRQYINLIVAVMLVFGLLAAPLQQIAFAEEDRPNAPDAVDAAMPPPILEFNGLDREDKLMRRWYACRYNCWRTMGR